MTTLHEQARAEAEKRTRAPGISGQTLPSMEQVAEWEGYRRGFVHGAEWAATRTRVVTTAADLEALPVKSLFRCRNGSAWGKDYDGTWSPVGDHIGRSSERMAAWLPGVVLYDPEETR